MVAVSRHEDIQGEVRGPGVIRKLTIDKSTGAGAITAGRLPGAGRRDPAAHAPGGGGDHPDRGAAHDPGRHRDRRGHGPTSWLAPGQHRPRARNIGDGQAVLIIAYPAVEVGATRVDVEF